MPDALPPPVTYRTSGVNIDAGNRFVDLIGRHVKKTHDGRVVELEDGYAGLFSLDYENPLLRRNYRRPVLVGTTDGAGTKTRIAQLLGKHDTIGIDLVAMCVNDLVVTGAEPLFFLDYIAAGKIDPPVLVDVVKGIADGCIEGRLSLIGGETAEHPGLMEPDVYDLAGFAVGVVERGKILNGSNTEEGDALVGIASSGLHSNGYSLVRRIFLPDGKGDLRTLDERLGCSLGEELLRPTRIYVRLVQRLLKNYKVKRVIRGFAHITGGGLVENPPRVFPKGLGGRIRKGSWPIPPIFTLVQERGSVPEEEMYRVLNMGIGYVVVVAKSSAQAVVRSCRRMKHKAWIIGEVVKGEGIEFV